jgi:peptidoglycan/xylan/chitin deacetylase (PgdA/CDA1 family)
MATMRAARSARAGDDRHRPHRAVAATGLALAAVHSAPALCAHVSLLRSALGLRDHIEDTGAVALTFDDGPDPRGTPATLAVLADASARATFFLTGEQVRDHPSVAAEIVAAGHDVGLHGFRHRNLLRVGPQALREDLARVRAAIADATGRSPQIYRPPYGIVTPAALAVTRRLGYETVLWNRWGRDWRVRATPSSIASEVTRDLQGGEILLLHDSDRYSARGSWRATVAALPAIVHAVEARGLSFAALPRVTPRAAPQIRRLR